MKVPALRDARYLQCLILIGYSFSAREYFNLERTHLTAIACVAWAISLDLLLGKLYFKRVIFPLSAVIIGLSAGILVDASHWAYYLLIVSLSILSKVFITYRGKHFFNPTNFGVVLAIQFLPEHVAAIPSLFSGFLWPSVIFAVLGAATVIHARQTTVTFSWFIGFAIFAFYRAIRAGSNAWLAFGPLFSSSLLLFTFHMISDPGTTPRTFRLQVAFGLLTAVIDGVLRIYQVPYGQFYALFAVSALYCFSLDWSESPVSLQRSL